MQVEVASPSEGTLRLVLVNATQPDVNLTFLVVPLQEGRFGGEFSTQGFPPGNYILRAVGDRGGSAEVPVVLLPPAGPAATPSAPQERTGALSVNLSQGKAIGSVFLDGACVGSGSTHLRVEAGEHNLSIECPPFFVPSAPRRVVVEPGGVHEAPMSCDLGLADCECRNTYIVTLSYRPCNAATPTSYNYLRCEGQGYCTTEDFIKMFGGTYLGR